MKRDTLRLMYAKAAPTLYECLDCKRGCYWLAKPEACPWCKKGKLKQTTRKVYLARGWPFGRKENV